MEEKDIIPEVAGWIMHHLNENPDAPLPEALLSYVAKSAENARLVERLTDRQLLVQLLQEREQYGGQREQNWERLKILMIQKDSEKNTAAPVHRLTLRRWWAAASVLLLLGMGAYLWKVSEKVNVPDADTVSGKEISPGMEGAILTLADGKQVVLDSFGNGLIAEQNGSRVFMKDGKVGYEPVGDSAAVVTFNSMTTPKGRQFQVTLPDGTKVWLNAASSIRYPTSFTGKSRAVELTGEAYFEVAKNKSIPFKVNIRDQAVVEVLGTDFNLNSYENEDAIRATLIEGSVRVVKKGKTRLLLPGQQATIKDNIEITTKADLDQVLAWKNGLFDFRNASFTAIMRQLERWYDIDVVYENGIPDVPLIGEMSRDVTLQGVLKNFALMGMNYRLEGRRLIILSKASR